MPLLTKACTILVIYFVVRSKLWNEPVGKQRLWRIFCWCDNCHLHYLYFLFFSLTMPSCTTLPDSLYQLTQLLSKFLFSDRWACVKYVYCLRIAKAIVCVKLQILRKLKMQCWIWIIFLVTTILLFSRSVDKKLKKNKCLVIYLFLWAHMRIASFSVFLLSVMHASKRIQH